MKKLHRSEKNKVFAGVIGGIAEYINIDPVVLRLVWIFLILITGVVPGLVVYLIAILVVPKKR